MGVQMQIASAALGLLAAKQSSDVAKMEAQSYKEQAELSKIQTEEKVADRNMQLRRQLASLGVSMTASGVALGTSASVGAIRNAEIDIAKKDIASTKLMGMSNRRKYEISATGKMAESRAITIGAVGKAAGQAYSINKGVA